MRIISGNYHQVFGSRLSSIKSLINRLIGLLKVTEQDLEDAGVSLVRYRD